MLTAMKDKSPNFNSLTHLSKDKSPKLNRKELNRIELYFSVTSSPWWLQERVLLAGAEACSYSGSKLLLSCDSHLPSRTQSSFCQQMGREQIDSCMVGS